MSFLIRRTSTYNQMSSRAIYESEYEESLKAYSEQIFPGYHLVTFKAKVASEYGGVQADMALIDKRLRNWTIVEVELEHHPFSAHVESQMRRLVYGNYGDEHARALHRFLPEIEYESLSELVRSTEPRFLVIAPNIPESWKAPLNNLGVLALAVEVYVDKQSDRVLRIHGQGHPTLDASVISVLRRNSFLPRTLTVESPAALPVADQLVAMLDGETVLLRRIATSREVLLSVQGDILLQHARYLLFEDQQGNLLIEGASDE